jgi:Ser/Thr protein kinase RdoA (MazF antagonist)
MKPFTVLSHAGQVRRLKRLGEEALGAYPIGAARLVPLQHEENTTFRVETPEGSRYVMRIHRPAKHTADEIRAETLWLAALRRDADLPVPEPVATTEGDLVTVAAFEGVPEERVCVLFRWMDGRFLDDGLTTAHLERVGMLTARLHQHTMGYTPPAGFTRGRVVSGSGGVRGQDDLRTDEAMSSITGLVTELCSAEAASTVEAVIHKVRQVCWELGEGPETFGLIHADLHQWNYLFHNGEARAIDFDDCGYGPFAHDLGTTLSELQHRSDYAALQAALLEGYRRVRPFPIEHEAYLETFFALRELQIMLWRMESREHPAFHDWAIQTERAVGRLRAFIEAQGLEYRTS